jgi:membrane fusion protein, multidrug efflux system
VPKTLDATLPKANEVGERRQRPGNLPHPEDEANDRGVRNSSTENQEDATPVHDIPGFLRRHKAWVIIAALASVVLGVGGTLWWLNARQYESTDDAFIDARVVPISAQVSGAVVDLAVTDNQLVTAGQTLLRIDDRDYRAALDQARAQVEQADATIANLGAQIATQEARIDQAKREVAEARAALTFAQEQNTRAQDLVNRGAGTVEAAQQAASDLKQKQEALDAAEAGEAVAEKQVAVLETQQQVARAELDQAKAQRETAEANLSRTVVKAPVDGYATKITAGKGAYAQPGQALMMFVPRDMWVTANFKETQLDLMRVGQPATIEMDAYPDTTFHGHIKSIQAGSGAAFSLLPPENATGNYVKVVQRVPVKIVFDNPPDVYVGPGMSVVPSVKVR